MQAADSGPTPAASLLGNFSEIWECLNRNSKAPRPVDPGFSPPGYCLHFSQMKLRKKKDSHTVKKARTDKKLCLLFVAFMHKRICAGRHNAGVQTRNQHRGIFPLPPSRRSKVRFAPAYFLPAAENHPPASPCSSFSGKVMQRLCRSLVNALATLRLAVSLFRARRFHSHRKNAEKIFHVA